MGVMKFKNVDMFSQFLNILDIWSAVWKKLSFCNISTTLDFYR